MALESFLIVIGYLLLSVLATYAYESSVAFKKAHRRIWEEHNRNINAQMEAARMWFGQLEQEEKPPATHNWKSEGF